MNIKLYSRDGVYYARIYHNKEAIRLSTGCKDLNLAKEELFKIDRLITDGGIANIKNRYLETKGESSSDLVELCEKYLREAVRGTIRTKSNSIIKPSSISTYGFSIKTLREYASFKGSIDLNDFTLDGLDLRVKSALSDRFDAYFNGLDSWMQEKEYKINTRADVIKNITIIVNHYKEKLFLNLPKIKSLGRNEPPIVVLDQEFVNDFVLNTLHTNNKDRFMWELSCVMMVTSLRISDAISLDKSDINNGFLIKENKKTGTNTSIPLPKVLADHISGNISEFGGVYSLNADESYYRKNIKKYFSKFPAMHKEVSIKITKPDGSKVVETKKMYDWVHPHMLRKTAITCMLSNGVSPEHVRFASGHKPNSSSFNRYVGFVESNFKSEIGSYYNKIFKQ